MSAPVTIRIEKQDGSEPASFGMSNAEAADTAVSLHPLLHNQDTEALARWLIECLSPTPRLS